MWKGKYDGISERENMMEYVKGKIWWNATGKLNEKQECKNGGQNMEDDGCKDHGKAF